MISSPDIPDIQIHPIPPESSGSLRFDLLPPIETPPDIALVIDRIWSDLREQNPRLHDGPILLAEYSRATGSPAALSGQPVRSCNTILPPQSQLPPTDTRATGSSPLWAATSAGFALTARPATYKSLASAAHLGMDVRVLGVQALVLARDADSDEHLLLGRRGSEVRIYQGLWENAPSGSVPPPPPDAKFIDWPHFTRALLDEGIEETGLDLSAANCSWVALLDDAEARSLDVVLKLTMHQTIDPRAVPCPADDSHRWEYAATAWTPLATLGAWAEQNAHAISPPTRALIRWLIDPADSRHSA